ncbi:hypothetical protein MKW92_033183 [Papaver armeniacum]|nr:hypothetical protein MKW92_033183 [Papaver armeniacum]
MHGRPVNGAAKVPILLPKPFTSASAAAGIASIEKGCWLSEQLRQRLHLMREHCKNNIELGTAEFVFFLLKYYCRA